MRTALLAVALSLTLAPACGGGGKKSIAEKIGQPTKNIADLKTDSKVSEEELARRRKEAGFVSKEEADAKLAAYGYPRETWSEPVRRALRISTA